MFLKIKGVIMNGKLIKVGISQGDINGIGYELILKTLEDARIFEFCIPVIYGSSKVLAYHRKTLESSSISAVAIDDASEATSNRINVINCCNEEVVVEFSQQTKAGEEAGKQALQKAIEDMKAGAIDVLLKAPTVNDYTNRIEFETGEGKKALKVFVKDGFRIALATDKIPFSDVPSLLNVELLTEKIKILQSSLVHDFMITAPRIAVLSLNPEIEDSEQLGKEEKEIIIPAVKAASDDGICCFGPYSADVFFGSGEYRKFDAILSMYYDQALIPFRSITYGEGVHYTAGLPFITATPDQGVSFELAGRNLCSADSFRNALYLAVDLFRNRQQDKMIYANPLKKQYFERGSDNEKLDLTKEDS